MSRYRSYINTAKAIIDQYKGQEPLAVFLKQFFAADKKYGSKDRKQIASLCYHYFRVGFALANIDIEEKLLAATLFCEHHFSSLLEHIRPEWNSIIGESVHKKAELLNEAFNETKLFPFEEELSNGIDKKSFAMSFLQQPKLFLRLRPGHEKTVAAKLDAIGVVFKKINDYCLALANSTRIDEEIAIDKEAVVQDYNSQQVGEVIRPFVTIAKCPINVWDCCAASGGKSIMLYDINNQIQLTVSDIRPSILHNLHSRFKRAGITGYQSLVTDLETGKGKLAAGRHFNFIIADVPCTGSGTWARTPEQLYFFKKETIDGYVRRQQKIIGHVIPHLVSGGYLIYITCSVFKKENEDMVVQILKEPGIRLIEMKLLTGYDCFADTMFVAILKKD